MTSPHPGPIGAVDIGGTSIAVGVIDGVGRVLAKEDAPTEAGNGFDAALERILGMLDSVRQRAGVDVFGIGVGCTGPVDPRSGVIGDVDFLPGWKGCNLVARLAERSELPVAMENDADAAALGEYLWGAGRGHQSLICITVGTGIGGGIIFKGALYRGVSGSHPEVGHHVIESEGPACFCGARGCWESLASGPSVVRQLLNRAPAGYADPNRLTCERVFALAREGDRIAADAVAREGHYLGIGIANLITLFAPDIIVLTGSVMKSADLLLPTIRETVRRHCGLVPAADVEIQLSALASDAPLIGASAVWRHRFMQSADPC